MTALDDLRPAGRQRVMDLVAEAGVDVDDWGNFEGGDANAAADPRYCYEWCFVEPGEVVVLCVWFDHLSEQEGAVVLSRNYRAWSHEFQLNTPGPRAQRAAGVDQAVRLAWREGLPVRVITCLDSNGGQEETRELVGRLLDTTAWSVTSYDEHSGAFVITRGSLAEPYLDQFTLLPEEHPEPPAHQLRLVDVPGRDAGVRRAVLRRAAGRCEFCGERGFITNSGQIYLETHHVVFLSEHGPDAESNVAALCSNHHREAHYGRRAELIRQTLLTKLANTI